MSKTVTNLKSIALSRRDTFTIDPKLVEDIPGLNERIDYGDLGQLKASIEFDGVVEDLLVRVEDGRVHLVKGYRRMRCVRELITEKKWKHKGVPCKSEPKFANEQTQLISRLIEQVAHNQGKPYTILEQGRVFKRLVVAGVKTTEIEQKTGLSRPAVKNALLLAEAEPKVLKEIAGGHISESLVIEFIRKSGGNKEYVATMVKGTIANAESAGKEKASRKHAPTSKNGTAGKTHKTNWKGVKGIKGGGSGGGGGSDRTSFDSTTNLTKLNKLMEELDRSACDPKCWDTIEAVIDFMEGKKSVADMKNYLRA